MTCEYCGAPSGSPEKTPVGTEDALPDHEDCADYKKDDRVSFFEILGMVTLFLGILGLAFGVILFLAGKVVAEDHSRKCVKHCDVTIAADTCRDEIWSDWTISQVCGQIVEED